MAALATQIKHDEAVRFCALHLLSSGYDVRARIEGWFQAPDYVYEYRPDIVARKGNRFILVEVKKGETDWPKIAAFERFEREQRNFRVIILSPDTAADTLGRMLHEQRR